LATSDLTHASFFSGVGGTDLGLEAAGWRTVSFSEVDPYANAVLAERWPGVPNLGDIVALADGWWSGQSTERAGVECPLCRSESGHGAGCAYGALLWSGGFPCQDLSVAGKRAGFAGERSVLAFAFLDLVRQHRPPAVLLENVPGLLSSHAGRDFGALLGTLGELRYGWAYRILDARFFGVPQRRRRVFILALDLERGLTADGAAEVLSVGSRCDRHPPTGVQAGPGVAEGVGDGAGVLGFDFLNTGSAFGDGETGSIPSRPGWSVVSQAPDADGMRAADGLAGRAHDLQHFRKSRAAQTDNDAETWLPDDYANSVNTWDQGDIRTKEIVLGGDMTDDPLLPLGLDSHRYRCCGNGVVAPVAEFIGQRLREALA
jgi:DNA-cytosine methyltransferase